MNQASSFEGRIHIPNIPLPNAVEAVRSNVMEDLYHDIIYACILFRNPIWSVCQSV